MNCVCMLPHTPTVTSFHPYMFIFSSVIWQFYISSDRCYHFSCTSFLHFVTYFFCFPGVRLAPPPSPHQRRPSRLTETSLRPSPSPNYFSPSSTSSLLFKCLLNPSIIILTFNQSSVRILRILFVTEHYGFHDVAQSFYGWF